MTTNEFQVTGMTLRALRVCGARRGHEGRRRRAGRGDRVERAPGRRRAALRLADAEIIAAVDEAGYEAVRV